MATNFLDKVICGDAVSTMQQLPAESIDMTMFSPPYYGLRNYGGTTEKTWSDGWKGQLGLEPTWAMYVDHINMICEATKRTLKPTGSMYLVLGDTYSSMLDNHGNRTAGFSEKAMVRDDAKPPKPKDYKPKCLMGIPWRIAFKLIEEGWILRNDIIWHKPNSMPSSVKDRLAQTYEHIFHFVKNERYYYDLDAIRLPHKTGWAPFKLRVRDMKSGKGGVSTSGQLKASDEEVQGYSEVRRDSPRARQRIEANLLHFTSLGSSGNYEYGGLDSSEANHNHPKGKNPGDTIKIGRHHGSSLTSGRAAYHTEQDIENHPLGSNPGDLVEASPTFRRPSWTVNTLDPRQKHERRYRKGVDGKDCVEAEASFERIRFPSWASTPGHPYGHERKYDANWDGSDFLSIVTKPFKGHHFAVYPEEICLRPILSSCPLGGVVLDPMCGSGTTLVIAKKVGRHYIGVDINPEYVEIARKRLGRVDDKLILEGELSNQ